MMIAADVPGAQDTDFALDGIVVRSIQWGLRAGLHVRLLTFSCTCVALAEGAAEWSPFPCNRHAHEWWCALDQSREKAGGGAAAEATAPPSKRAALARREPEQP